MAASTRKPRRFVSGQREIEKVAARALRRAGRPKQPGDGPASAAGLGGDPLGQAAEQSPDSILYFFIVTTPHGLVFLNEPARALVQGDEFAPGAQPGYVLVVGELSLPDAAKWAARPDVVKRFGDLAIVAPREVDALSDLDLRGAHVMVRRTGREITPSAVRVVLQEVSLAEF